MWTGSLSLLIFIFFSISFSSLLSLSLSVPPSPWRSPRSQWRYRGTGVHCSWDWLGFFIAESYPLSRSNMASTSSLSGMSTKPSFKPQSSCTCIRCLKKLQTNAQLIMRVSLFKLRCWTLFNCKTLVVLKLIRGLNRNHFSFGFSSVDLPLLTTLHLQSFILECRDTIELPGGSLNLKFSCVSYLWKIAQVG